MPKKLTKLTADIEKLSPKGQQFVKAVITGDTSQIVPADNFEIAPIPQNAETKDVALAIEEISVSYAKSITLLREEIKKINELLKDGYENDAEYREQFKTTDTEKKKLKLIKDRLLSLPGSIELTQKLKDLRSEMKEKQLSLSDYLLELERMVGVNQLELFPGEVWEIVKTAKLIKSRKMPK